MKRISLFLAGALACLVAASAPRGDADRRHRQHLLQDDSKIVIGHKLTLTVTGKNVAQTQKKFAECQIVKKVANKMLSIRIEKPKVFEGFRCTPRVLRRRRDGRTAEGPLQLPLPRRRHRHGNPPDVHRHLQHGLIFLRRGADPRPAVPAQAASRGIRTRTRRGEATSSALTTVTARKTAPISRASQRRR